MFFFSNSDIFSILSFWQFKVNHNDCDINIKIIKEAGEESANNMEECKSQGSCPFFLI